MDLHSNLVQRRNEKHAPPPSRSIWKKAQMVLSNNLQCEGIFPAVMSLSSSSYLGGCIRLSASVEVCGP